MAKQIKCSKVLDTKQDLTALSLHSLRALRAKAEDMGGGLDEFRKRVERELASRSTRSLSERERAWAAARGVTEEEEARAETRWPLVRHVAWNKQRDALVVEVPRARFFPVRKEEAETPGALWEYSEGEESGRKRRGGTKLKQMVDAFSPPSGASMQQQNAQREDFELLREAMEGKVRVVPILFSVRKGRPVDFALLYDANSSRLEGRVVRVHERSKQFRIEFGFSSGGQQ